MKLYEELIEVLKKDERFCTEDGTLLKNKVYEASIKMDNSLISSLLGVELLKENKAIFVGDGINDAPVLARADIGVAMGGAGSDAAIEAADIVLMTDDLMSLAAAIGVAKQTRQVVGQNIIFALGTKLIVMLLGILGMANMWLAIFADVGVSLIAILNSIRILRKNIK